jgi:hypothetical protein
LSRLERPPTAVSSGWARLAMTQQHVRGRLFPIRCAVGQSADLHRERAQIAIGEGVFEPVFLGSAVLAAEGISQPLLLGGAVFQFFLGLALLH